MKNALYDYGFGSAWKDVHVYSREGYHTSVADYHEHDFYEINLILSGNCKILIGDRAEEGSGNRIILTRPLTPHFVSCLPDTLYSRLYLVFSRDFIENYLPEWEDIAKVFGINGKSIKLSPKETDICKRIIENIDEEKEPFRKRLLIFYLLSYIGELKENEVEKYADIPQFIIEALSFIDKNYREKITAEKLAKSLHIGRTTLMTSFKKYTGSTLNDYITNIRLKNAIKKMSEGRTLSEIALDCGFCDTGNLIRNFKLKFGMTPKQYLQGD